MLQPIGTYVQGKVGHTQSGVAPQFSAKARRLASLSQALRSRHNSRHPAIMFEPEINAAKMGGLAKRGTGNTLRFLFATQFLESAYDIRTFQELLGHKDVKTTMIATHIWNRGGKGVKNPVDDL